jgi:MoxR-like ATPase
MSARRTVVLDIREIIRQSQAGQSARQIAKNMHLSRVTVGTYRTWAGAHDLLSQALPTAEALAVALAAAEHVFVYGPPGTAKSSLLRCFASGVGGRFFRILLNPDITREDLVGPLDPQRLFLRTYL